MTTILSNFLLVKKFSNNNDKNIKVKNIQKQKQKKETLESAA